VANRLANETSPYLLQHKDNPVDWFPWGKEALDRAAKVDKPIFLSIGYSSCHWCHVMEHESFENPETAAYLNDHFVSIKVDREERPDLDSIYMTAVQALTGHGGWPMSVFLAPDQVPFYGGTYWPDEPRQGMPSFRSVLEAVSDAYRNKRDDVAENARQVRAFLQAASSNAPRETNLSGEVLDEAFANLVNAFDNRNGGFGNAPKFPQPSIVEFLLRYHKRTGSPRAAQMASRTLDQMAAGGIFDQIGGGFHRYSVDAIWLVPHFEKMLYDNAQLVKNYLDGYRLFGHARYAEVARDILNYVATEMTSPGGGFFSTQDADTDGQEGKFYLWTVDEIDELLPAEDADIAKRFWEIRPGGNFEGKTILTRKTSLADLAAEVGIPLTDLEERIGKIRRILGEERAKRTQPGRDEKIIASWNGMMIRAFVEAGSVLDDPSFIDIASAAGTFLLKDLFLDSMAFHSIKDGQTGIGAYLDDFANVIDAYISLYEATFQRRWIDAALVLTGRMLDLFSDPATPFFFDDSSNHEPLVARPRDIQDGAVPSGNAVAASVLVKLSWMTENADFEIRARDILSRLATVAAAQPLGFGKALAAIDAYLATPKEVAVAAARSDPKIEEFRRAMFSIYEPNAILGYAEPKKKSSTKGLPFLEQRPLRNGEAAAYVCEHYACLPPVVNGAALVETLKTGTGISWSEF
jgi:uncharacterized protein